MLRRQIPRWRTVCALGGAVVLGVATPSEGGAFEPSKGGSPARATEVHFTFSGPTSVTFDWVGAGTSVRYGRTARYTKTAVARTPSPRPFSSPGPFREATLSGMRSATTYHYSIGGGPDRTFSIPGSRYRFDAEGDVGDSGSSGGVAPTQVQIARDRPSFVLALGDLTYGNDDGQSAVDRHFNDVMAWSQSAAYMPVWGNHEWDESSDDLRNYKGRFKIPHPHASPGAPGAGCCGEDWGWFDAGPVRFISYPEPYTDATWNDWRVQAGRVMAEAETDARIKFIVTFGHRPAYSSGYHRGEPQLASVLDGFGDRYSKYVLNLNGHSHDYERFEPIHHVVHITSGGGGQGLEPVSSKDPRTVYRAMHLNHLRITVTPAEIRVEAVCGPATSDDDTSCSLGATIDSYTIPAPR
jgi:Calcineurin-like phosphoesterase